MATDSKIAYNKRAERGVVPFLGSNHNACYEEQRIMATDQRRSCAPSRQTTGGRPGRVIASNGYVLVKVGKDHHLADVRGYAYEHRLVAEQKLGRKLLSSELVHHLDENKQNNDQSNLEVVGSIAEHRVHHRRKSHGLRMPGEDNPLVECACGCNTKLRKYDKCGRPRQFVSGHNPQKRSKDNGRYFN